MSPKGFFIDGDIEKALKADSEVWGNFQKFPPLYQRVRIDTIQIKKKQPELFQSRLQKLIDNTRKGVIVKKGDLHQYLWPDMCVCRY